MLFFKFLNITIISKLTSSQTLIDKYIVSHKINIPRKNEKEKYILKLNTTNYYITIYYLPDFYLSFYYLLLTTTTTITKLPTTQNFCRKIYCYL